MGKAKILDKVTRFLVGSEKMAPEALQAARKFVGETGRINHQALGDRRLLGDLLIGKKGTMQALKGRFSQGGVFGPGGLVAGEIAVDPKFKDLIKNYRGAPKGSRIVDPYTGASMSRAGATGKLVAKGLGESVNPLFVLGFPAMDIASAINTPDEDEHGGMSGVLGALGSGLGFAVAGPLGLVGSMGAGHVGQRIGSSVGKIFDPKEKSPNTFNKAASQPASPLILDAAIPF
jgi:hypothetical protein